ncbi:MAG: pyruvate kinase [Flavobacteriales bacterium]|nr:pyruvate kinase [Flavobacteriales bacterium]MCX7768133.1 pyruvate kinase [Flavobacteriales bacterium]MDW8409575.1 pyruvate kinase [Flavobacteriales bacterium]
MKTSTLTKLIATIGPASSEPEVLRAMLLEGVDVCRINCSHSTHEKLSSIIDTVRRLNEELGTHVPILADLQGPKIRIGDLESASIELKDNEELTITTRPVAGNPRLLSINYSSFAKDVKPGHRVLLDDGKIGLEVVDTDRNENVRVKVVYGGVLFPRKGVNLPDTHVSLPALTEKDLKDLEFVLSKDVEWVGLSFVRSASDVLELKHLIRKYHKEARVVAKIEKPEALYELDDIIQEADAVMVARGDLGVELPMEEVPLLQKTIVKKCLEKARPVIIATQMMESMITQTTPTRAEVNDAANSILDGADALMLSAETSTGRHPVEVVRTMKRIMRFLESHERPFPVLPDLKLDTNVLAPRRISEYICRNACILANEAGAAAIVAMTGSGYSAIRISSFRPRARVFAFTSNPTLIRTLNLVWGITPALYDKFVSTDHTIADIKLWLRQHGHVKPGDLVVHVASIPMEERGMSNMIKMSYV